MSAEVSLASMLLSLVLKLWSAVVWLVRYIGYAFAAPVRIQRIEAKLQRDPPRPTKLAYGVRWARSDASNLNDPFCEVCYQYSKGEHLMPMHTFDEEHEKSIYARCNAPAHDGKEWVLSVKGESWRHARQQLKIP